MNYLLDTNGWIAFFENAPELSDQAANLLEDSDSVVYVSIASVWEAAIKVGLGKLRLPYDLKTDLPHILETCGFQLLPITLEDAAEVERLVVLHRDPFDRLQIIQAKRRNFSVISRDPIFARYGLRCVW